MATVNYVLNPQKADGTYPISIRLTHNRVKKYYKTSLVALKKDVTTSKKLKGALAIQVEEMLTKYRKIINELNLDVNDYSLDSIYNKVFLYSSKGVFDFISWAQAWCEKHKNQPSVRTQYFSALNSFKAFKGEKVMVTDMTTKTMLAFEKHLSDKVRAKSSYTTIIKRLFREMRDEYNDYDYDDIVIRNTMASYQPPKQQAASKKRALSIEEIRKIFDCPYDNKKNSRGYGSRHDIALDCFRLSFCLMGTNSVDLYEARRYDNGYLIYERQKTKDRREDNAEIQIKVLPQIQDVFDKYYNAEEIKKWKKAHTKWMKDKKGDEPLRPPVFNFYLRYTEQKAFNKYINKGLSDVADELGIKSLTFYAARHSMATIAVNDVKISKYIVNDMLNHVDQQLKVTEIYLKKNFDAINEANEKLLSFVFPEE